MNYFDLHIGDYEAATAHLSHVEDAIYSRMLRLYYRQESPLPVAPESTARLVRSADQIEIVKAILLEFFTLADDGWHHKRCDEVIARYREKSHKAKVSAAASVEARRKTNSEIRGERMAAAKEKGTHTAAEWGALVMFCGGRCVRCGTEGPVVKDHIVPVYQGGSDAIDNLQPLCARCNASKGPESTDHRPDGWRAFVERSLSVRSANQEPITNNQEPEEQKKGRGKRAPSLPCPADVDPQTWGDWLLLRKAKSAPVTETVVRTARTEADKAGMPLTAFLAVWCARGSQGLQADWLKPNERAGPATAKPNAAADFRGKSYDATPIDQLPPDLRAAAERALRDG